MLNRTPPKSSNTIQSFRKKRQLRGPIMMYGAIGLVVLGFILLVYWLTRPGQPLGQFFATETPTATVTFTPTSTSTPTLTPTITETPTVTVTFTPSGPTQYTIQEGDSLEAIAQRFNLGPDGILLILDANPGIMADNNGVIFVGQEITVPPPGTTRATSTPIPGSVPRGTRVEYQVLPGDTLAGIAVRFNSVQEDILTANPDLGEDANALQVGQILQIPVNLITPTATLPATSTPVTPTVPGGQPTAAATTAASTRPPGGTGTASCAFDENAQFVTQLQDLINDERTAAGLPALTVNAQLTTAAQNHAVNMLCNNYLSHIGLDGSTPEQRVEAAGFNASLVVENLFALHPAYGGNPQAAVEWWMSDPVSTADLLHEDTTQFGIAYVSSDTSLLGGYFVVISASQ
jgi:uncharacterized protein YkwD